MFVYSTCQCSSLSSVADVARRAGCDGKMDVVFILDSSGSIRRSRFDTLKRFIADVVGQLEVAQARTRVGLVTFSDSAKVEFEMKKYERKEDVLKVKTRRL